MSSVSLYKGKRQQGSVLLMVLLLLWAMTHYLLAGMQALNHQSRWLLALSHGTERHANARAAISRTIDQIKKGQTQPVNAHQGFVVYTERLLQDGNHALYLLSVRHQNSDAQQGHGRFLQAVYGNGVRAVWLP